MKKLTEWDSKFVRQRAENMRLLLKVWPVEKVAGIFELQPEDVYEIVREWEIHRDKVVEK